MSGKGFLQTTMSIYPYKKKKFFLFIVVSVSIVILFLGLKEPEDIEGQPLPPSQDSVETFIEKNEQQILQGYASLSSPITLFYNSIPLLPWVIAQKDASYSLVLDRPQMIGGVRLEKVHLQNRSPFPEKCTINTLDVSFVFPEKPSDIEGLVVYRPQMHGVPLSSVLVWDAPYHKSVQDWDMLFKNFIPVAVRQHRDGTTELFLRYSYAWTLSVLLKNDEVSRLELFIPTTDAAMIESLFTKIDTFSRQIPSYGVLKTGIWRWRTPCILPGRWIKNVYTNGSSTYCTLHTLGDCHFPIITGSVVLWNDIVTSLSFWIDNTQWGQAYEELARKFPFSESFISQPLYQDATSAWIFTDSFAGYLFTIESKEGLVEVTIQDSYINKIASFCENIVPQQEVLDSRKMTLGVGE